MRPIARAVERALHALGLDRDVARAEAVRAWHDAATSVFGSDGGLTKAIRADGDTLVVTVPSAQWAGELRLRERELIAAVTERAPACGIIRVRPIPASTPTR
jgi:hypothetical protein